MGGDNINGTSTYGLVKELTTKVDALSGEVQEVKLMVSENRHDLKTAKIVGGAILTTSLAVSGGLVLLFASSFIG